MFCGTRRGQCSSTLATVIRAFCMELRGANNRKIVAAGQSTSWPRWDATGMRLELLLLTMRPCLDNCKRNIPHTPSLPFCLENIKSLEGAQREESTIINQMSKGQVKTLITCDLLLTSPDLIPARPALVSCGRRPRRRQCVKIS